MTTQKESLEKRRLSLWRKRASYKVGKTRHQRKEQHRLQMNIFMLVVLAAAVAGIMTVIFNWRGAGSTKTVSCAEFPIYCVPLVGGGSDALADVETAASRELDANSKGADGVARGISADGIPIIGNPDAPIHFAIVSDFACPHCQDYHNGDLKRFIRDYVITGKATVQLSLQTGTGGAFSQTASQGALCAGEQGAFWEMSDEFYRLGESMSYDAAFSISQIRESADDMGLDENELVDCISSGRYLNVVTNNRYFASDNGVTGTPTVLVSYGDSGVWAKVDNRLYDTLRALTEEALANAAN
ncbi:MAG: thioredoxin domain-containing protein [Anaerolineae bacterium]|nr:thioredoxin domain-containing protein [Anaerolineae bacterium]